MSADTSSGAGLAPDILLLTVTDAKSERWAEINRALRSIEQFLERRTVRLQHLLLVQSVRSEDVVHVESRPFLHLETLDRLLPSSAARNRLLIRASADGLIGSDTIVAFPDDDAWYPPGTLERITDAFADDPLLDFLVTRYSSSPDCSNGVEARQPSLQQAITASSCNTIVLRGRLQLALGLFDERLGLGVAAQGGEDTDFGMRAFVAARRSRWIDAPLVGHRDMRTELKSRYFPGALMAIARNRTHRSGVRLALVRKLLVGVHMMMRGRMSVSDFGRALAMAWRFRNATPPQRPEYLPSSLTGH